MQRPRTTTRLIAGALVLAVLASGSAAAQQPLTAGTQTHAVQRGDTLWDLARRYLGDPFLWPQIYKQNTAVVEDPHWIYPGEMLTISGGTAPSVPGADTPTTDVATDDPAPGTLGGLGENAEAATETGESVFPRLGSRAIATESWRIDPQTYRALRPSEFYSSGFLTETREFTAGRMLGPTSPLQIGAVASQTRGTALLYASVSVEAPSGEKYEVGDSVLVFYYGKEIEGYGRVIHPTGLVRITQTESGKVFGSVVALYGPIRAGQSVVRAEKFSDGGKQRAVPVADGLSATVIGWPAYMELKDPLDVIFIDKGKQAGVRPGDVFELRRTPANNGEMADLMATLTVVRVGERTSTARVMKVTSPRIAVGVVAKQVARLPS
jgi:LysM repeat protein